MKKLLKILKKIFWHKEFFQLCIILAACGIVGLILLASNKLEDIECFKSKNICTIYTYPVFNPNNRVPQSFKISDLKDLKIERQKKIYQKNVMFRKGYYYNPVIYLNNGKKIYFESISFKNEKEANEFAGRFWDKEDFHFKNNLLKFFFNWY